jgi:hypothetical protein
MEGTDHLHALTSSSPEKEPLLPLELEVGSRAVLDTLQEKNLVTDENGPTISLARAEWIQDILL